MFFRLFLHLFFCTYMNKKIQSSIFQRLARIMWWLDWLIIVRAFSKGMMLLATYTRKEKKEKSKYKDNKKNRTKRTKIEGKEERNLIKRAGKETNRRRDFTFYYYYYYYFALFFCLFCLISLSINCQLILTNSVAKGNYNSIFFQMMCRKYRVSLIEYIYNANRVLKIRL